jgi:pimeloyl-ACP methyl ester carboxylesterase
MAVRSKVSDTFQVEVSGNTVFGRRYGTGPAVPMVHGFPRTSLMWRFLAPTLAEHRTVICIDLRAYGQRGPLDRFYAQDGGSLGIWRQWAPRVYGQAMKGGHFFPEENPDDTAALLTQFLAT